MMRLSVASAAAFAAFALCEARPIEEVRELFSNFKKDFKRGYEAVEHEARFLAFAANAEFIEAENAKGHSYKLGLTPFADMSNDEFVLSHMGFRQPSKPWSGLPYLGSHQAENVTLPETVDWVQKGVVSAVKNQGQCGSCWAFSTIGALEGAWAIATGQLQTFSEQQLVDCARGFGEKGCGGGSMDGGFQYAQSTAICTEDSYPYQAQNSICRASSCAQGLPQGGVVGYKDVPHQDANALMSAVSQQPVSIAIEADEMVFQLYKGGVLTGACGQQLDHGVLCVGYGTENGQDYWLVKNSWGPQWGEGGYIKLLRGSPGAGECGITIMPSYPVVQVQQMIVV